MSFQRFLSIVRKEVAQLLRDRRTLGTIITLPIIQLVLYGYLSNEVLHQPTAVWDQSNTAESRVLVQTFENTRYFSVRYYVSSLREIERRLDAGQAKIGVVIPPEYARRIRAGEPVQVMVVVDASDATSARVILSVAAGVGASISHDVSLVQLRRRGQRPPPQAVEVRTRAWYNPNLQSQLFIVPGVLGLVLQFTTTFLTIGTIVRERELGTFEQLVVTPIRPAELMLGKIVPLIGLGYINLTFILLLAWAWFGGDGQGQRGVALRDDAGILLLRTGHRYADLDRVAHVQPGRATRAAHLAAQHPHLRLPVPARVAAAAAAVAGARCPAHLLRHGDPRHPRQGRGVL